MDGDAITAPSLRIQCGGEVERLIEVRDDSVVIGRSSDCDVILDKPTVSSHHARLFRGPDGYYLEDIGSRNDTYCDGKPIKDKGPVLLTDGQSFRICDYWLVFNGTRVWIEETDESSSSIRASVEVGSNEGIERLVTRPDEALHAVLELSRTIGSTLDIDEVLDKALESLMLIFPQADRGFVYLMDEHPINRGLVPRRFRSRQWIMTPYTISRTVIEEVLDRAVALCCENVPGHEKFSESESLALAGIRSMICAPILDSDRRPIGMLQLDAQNARKPFGSSDLDLLLAMLGPIGVAVENARYHEELLHRRQRDRELQYAQDIQRALLPEEPPRPAGYDFWHYYQSAHEVGGDYFGYLPPGVSIEGVSAQWVITLGDVAGKGMPAALLMAKLSAEVPLALAAESEPARVLDRLNRRVHEADLPDSFITFALIVLDTENHRIWVNGAGHPSPIIRRADGRIEQIEAMPQGPPLGVLLDCRFDPAEVPIAPGDLVLLYTDGAIDAINSANDRFGTHRLLQTVADGPGRVDQIGPFVIETIERFSAGAPQADDITLICFGRQP